MSGSPPSGIGTRGAEAHHIMVRLALEGVPVAVIGRSLKTPAGDVETVLREARDSGQIAALPAFDWKPGQDRSVAAIRPARFADLGQTVDLLCLVYGMTARQGKVLAALMQRPMVSREGIYQIIYGDQVEREPKIIEVTICQLRKHLAPYKIIITTVWGRGYALSAASREALGAAIKKPAEAVLRSLDRGEAL